MSGDGDGAGGGLADQPLGEGVFREIYHSINDGIFVHDAETGEILDVNERVTELYGYSRSEARGLSVAELSSREPPYLDSARESRRSRR